MELDSQPAVYLTEGAQNIKSPRGWKLFVVILLVVLFLVILTLAILVIFNPNFLPDNLKINLFNFNKNASTKKAPQVIQKINPNLKSGEFLITEPSPVDTSKISSEQQVIIEGTFDTANNTITIKNISSQVAIKHSDTVPIPPSIPWIIIETRSSGNLTYSTRFPLVYKEGQTIIPFWINVPYAKQFDLSIYSQDRKLLFSQPINL